MAFFISDLKRPGFKSMAFFILWEADEKDPSAAFSGRLTVSAAWRRVAPYSSQRHPSSFFDQPPKTSFLPN